MYSASKTAKRLLISMCLALAPAASALNPDLRFWQYDFQSPPPEVNLDSDVYDVAQSHDGFLWLATGRGLIRYDGLDTVIYRTANHPGLVSNLPTGLFVTTDNQLLITSENGVSRYDGQTFEPLISGNKWSASIHAIAQDEAGALWLGSEQGLWVMRNAHIDTDRYAGKVSQISSLLAHDATIYAGGQGVVYVIRDGMVSTRPLPDTLASARIEDLVVHQGQIYGATHRGMFRLEDGLARHLDNELVRDLHVEILLSDRDDNLWFGGERAVGRFFPNGEIELPNVEDEALGFVPQLSAFIEDNTGQVWHTSAFFGITSLRDTVVRRVSYTEGLPSPAVAALTADASGKVFVATDKGISELTGESIAAVVEEDFVLSGRIRALHVDASRRLWVGTETGLRRIDLDSGEWSDKRPLQLPVNALAMVAGDDSDLWVATDLGLHRIADDQIDTVLDANEIAIESLHFSRDGTLWLGTEHGLATLNGDQITYQASDLPDAAGAVVAIVERPDGQIIAATANNGLLIQHDGQWHQFGETQGLPPEKLIDIELHGESLWLVTSAGVFRLPTTELDAATSELDVLPVLTRKRYRALHNVLCCAGTNDSAALIANGILVAATDDGIITFDLDATSQVRNEPAPYIKSLTIDGVEYAPDDSSRPDLSAANNYVKIAYSAIDLTNGEQLEFRYRLRGLGDAWISMGRVRTVQLQGLPPGDLEFELQASSVPGRWSQTAARVPFHRRAMWHETVGFRIALWCGSIALVLGLFWLRSTRTRRQHAKLEQSIKKRTRKLRELNAQLATKNQDLRQASETDALTGLYNRRYFDTRHNDSDLADSLCEQGLVIILDIDHFKRVNDTHGHGVGDDVLRQFAEVLRAATRQSDLISRWGGEEFMLLCHCQTAHAPVLLERLVSAVRNHPFTLEDGTRLPVTCSVGSIRYPLWPDQSLPDRFAILLELADAALYSVKAQGRDGWVMLEGVTTPNFPIKVRRAGPLMGSLLQHGHLNWHASRAQIVAPDELQDTGS